MKWNHTSLSKRNQRIDTAMGRQTLRRNPRWAVWEAVFEILCELGVEWVRPKALKYDGKNYFADFYLPTYDIWLDPKNDFKAKQDAGKIHKVIEQNSVNVFVLLKQQITKEYIASLVK